MIFTLVKKLFWDDPPPYYLLNFPILEQRIAPHQDLFWIPAGFLFSPGHWDKGDFEHDGPQPRIQSAEYVHFGQSAEYDTCTRKFFYGIQLCTPKMRICTPNVPAQNLGPNADTRKKVFIFNIWLCMASIPFSNYSLFLENREFLKSAKNSQILTFTRTD